MSAVSEGSDSSSEMSTSLPPIDSATTTENDNALLSLSQLATNKMVMAVKLEQYQLVIE